MQACVCQLRAALPPCPGLGVSCRPAVPAVPAVPAGRTLTRIEAVVAGTPVFVATTHLEPGGGFDLRSGQMGELQERMREAAAAAPNCIVAGARMRAQGVHLPAWAGQGTAGMQHAGPLFAAAAVNGCLPPLLLLVLLQGT